MKQIRFKLISLLLIIALITGMGLFVSAAASAKAMDSDISFESKRLIMIIDEDMITDPENIIGS